jgi:hypothetical protein
MMGCGGLARRFSLSSLSDLVSGASVPRWRFERTDALAASGRVLAAQVHPRARSASASACCCCCAACSRCGVCASCRAWADSRRTLLCGASCRSGRPFLLLPFLANNTRRTPVPWNKAFNGIGPARRLSRCCSPQFVCSLPLIPISARSVAVFPQPAHAAYALRPPTSPPISGREPLPRPPVTLPPSRSPPGWAAPGLVVQKLATALWQPSMAGHSRLIQTAPVFPTPDPRPQDRRESWPAMHPHLHAQCGLAARDVHIFKVLMYATVQQPATGIVFPLRALCYNCAATARTAPAWDDDDIEAS